MKKILYYEVVFDKKHTKIVGHRPEYGHGSWWIIGLITLSELISHYAFTFKRKLEKRIRRTKGKVEKN